MVILIQLWFCTPCSIPSSLMGTLIFLLLCDSCKGLIQDGMKLNFICKEQKRKKKLFHFDKAFAQGFSCLDNYEAAASVKFRAASASRQNSDRQSRAHIHFFHRGGSVAVPA